VTLNAMEVAARDGTRGEDVAGPDCHAAHLSTTAREVLSADRGCFRTSMGEASSARTDAPVTRRPVAFATEGLPGALRRRTASVVSAEANQAVESFSPAVVPGSMRRASRAPVGAGEFSGVGPRGESDAALHPGLRLGAFQKPSGETRAPAVPTSLIRVRENGDGAFTGNRGRGGASGHFGDLHGTGARVDSASRGHRALKEVPQCPS
jgi:hypothetical protein